MILRRVEAKIRNDSSGVKRHPANDLPQSVAVLLGYPPCQRSDALCQI